MPYLDPTTNVLALVEAAVKRLDDLQKVEVARLERQLDDHIEYTKQLAAAESKRIDAIRAVDVGAVAIASDRAGLQATALAAQVVASAEALRATAAATVLLWGSQLREFAEQLGSRISILEKAQYESKGSSEPTPIQRQITELERLQDVSTGKGQMSSTLIILISTIVGGLIVFIVQMAISHMGK